MRGALGRRAASALVSILGAIGSVTDAGARPELSLEARIAAQEAIEKVYYAHRSGTTVPFGVAVPRTVIEQQVRTSLKLSVALRELWHESITATMLQRETERMFRESKRPDRLLEIVRALGDDPVLFRECVARPALARRLVRNAFAFDERVHAAPRREIEQLTADLLSGRIDPAAAHSRRSVIGEAEALRSGTRFASAPGAIEESAEAFTVSLRTEHDLGEHSMVRYTIPKTGWDNWWAVTSPGLDEATALHVADLTGAPLPTPSQAVTCAADDTWDESGFDGAPVSRSNHTAVWTGTEMIVWGGNNGVLALNTGGRYDPALDIWSPVSTVGAPSPRMKHTAVWTGSRMIIWGGRYVSGQFNLALNTGAQYDPVTDSWSLTTLQGAPAAVYDQTAAWSGSEMIIWGGKRTTGPNTNSNEGAAYNPALDSWRTLPLAGAPPAFSFAQSVWTGDRLLVWGVNGNLDAGGRYDPVANAWSPISATGAPHHNATFTATWTGSWMVTLGGISGSTITAGRYNAASDTWSTVSSAGAPAQRYEHAAVWTGTEVLVWGGSHRSDGALYNPSTNSWRPTAALNTPTGRSLHTAVWTGTLMIVWGAAASSSGGRYDPVANSWMPTSTGSGPSPRGLHTAVWTGNEMIVWGGSDTNMLGSGSRFDPATASWSPTSTVNSPLARKWHSAVWTGSRMIIWGGVVPPSSSSTNTGAEYDPITDSWTATPTAGAPVAMRAHAAVWTGTEMIVHGGIPGGGGRYDPGAGTWSPVNFTGAPQGRADPAAAWTGSLMLVWGGELGQTGARYDPLTDQWSPISTVNAPTAIQNPVAEWTGSRMIVWGAPTGAGTYGGAYDPALNVWTGVTTVDSSPATWYPVSVWTGERFIVWGGAYGQYTFNTGGRYDPATDSWLPTSFVAAPLGRWEHSAVWTGTQMIIWGGSFSGAGGAFSTTSPYLGNGAAYNFGGDTDADGDGLSLCSGDCNDADPDSLHAPVEVVGVAFDPDRITLRWSSATPWSGTNVVYDVLRGAIPDTSVGGTGEVCLASSSPSPSAADAAMPSPGSGFWYLVRAKNGCATGPYGSSSAGVPQVSSTCF